MLGKYKFLVKEGWEKTFLVLKFFCFLHVTNTYLFTGALTYGPSMLPALGLNANFLLAEKISTRLGKVGVGDIVVVRSPQNPRKYLTKRLVGIEGDSVTYVVDPQISDRSETVVVPKGHIWIQGDNPYNSKDSRSFGPIPYGLLQGKVFWRIWPPKEFGSLGKN